MIKAGTSAGEAITRIAAALADAGVDSPRLDARLLVESATGLTREQLVLQPGRALGQAEATRLAAFVTRRLAREPVTRIAGHRSFYGRDFIVTPATLDPRPETETLVDLALGLAREEGWSGKPIEILDIGTGTGCILLTLLAELGGGAHGTGVDVSAPALEIARENAVRLGLADRVTWTLTGRVDDIRAVPDLVVSNPPYIPRADIEALDPEVRSFDPRPALDGGLDGLDVVRDIVTWSKGRTRTWFVMEFGAGQAEAIVELINACCGADTSQHARLQLDLGGHTRCVAWKPRS